jgi:secretion/DNA translocation related TadE-like protein
MRHASGTDRGAATILAAAVIAVVLVLTAGGLVVLGAVDASHRARLAADLAAIGAATRLQETADPGGACVRADSLAMSNGARLTDCAVSGAVVDVRVEVDPATWPAPATARARAGPGG